MKTPPPNLPPIPEGFTYIGVDDGSLIEEGCPYERILAFQNEQWCSGYCDGSPPCNLPIAAPTGSLLHMLNSVPATSESAAARMLLDAFAEQVKALKEDLERERICHAACGVIANANTRESLANACDMAPDYMSGSVADCIAATEREIALREERDELLEIRDMMTQQINSLRTELARVRETLKNFTAAAEAMEAEAAK